MAAELIVTAYFDGLTEPNPDGCCCGGWWIEPAWVPALVNGKGGSTCYGQGANMTNNVAEYNAALDCLRDIWRAGHRGRVILHGDSQLVIKQTTGEWACNKEHLWALRHNLLRAIGFFEAVELRWVPREENWRADEQSRLAYRKETGREAPERGKKRPKPELASVRDRACIDCGVVLEIPMIVCTDCAIRRQERDGDGWLERLAVDAREMKPEGTWLSRVSGKTGETMVETGEVALEGMA